MKVKDIVAKLQMADQEAETMFVDQWGEGISICIVSINKVSYNFKLYDTTPEIESGIDTANYKYGLTRQQWKEVKRNGRPVVILE